MLFSPVSELVKQDSACNGTVEKSPVIRSKYCITGDRILNYCNLNALHHRPVVPADAAFTHCNKASVDTVLFHKGVVSALLGNLTVLDNKYFIGISYCVESVSNYDKGLALAKLAYSLLDIALVVSVNACGSLVKNNDRSVLQNTACD